MSMSLDRDNLNLWSYHTKNAHSIGCSIGLKERTIESLCRHGSNETLLSGKVIYDPKNQKQLFLELSDDYWQRYSKLKHTYQREHLFEKMEDIQIQLTRIMP